MNTIHIQILGAAGSGKSIIEQEVVDGLRKLGFAVKWDIKPDHKSEEDIRKTGMDRLNVLERVSEQTTVVVKGIQVNKDINASLNYRVTKPKK